MSKLLFLAYFRKKIEEIFLLYTATNSAEEPMLQKEKDLKTPKAPKNEKKKSTSAD
jgi:hypothetical protein